MPNREILQRSRPYLIIFLQEQGITTQASITNGCLKLILESPQVPDKKSLVPLVSKAINQLNIESINSVKVVGQIIGADSPRWIQFIGVNNHQVQTKPQTTEPIAHSQPNSQQQNTNTNTTTEPQTTESNVGKNVGKFILTIFIFFSLNGQVLMLLKFLGIGNNVPVTASTENKASLESELPAETLVDDSYETEYIDSESDDFQEAVNQATSAANLTQTAKTQDDWNQVKDEWQEAIDLMKEVSESDPNYSVAQNRVIQYQNNFNYAQKMTEKLATQETVKYGFFKDGIKEATTAAFLVQKAKTKDEWEYISTIWEKAIEYMKAVQPSDPNYQAAQDRVIQYQKNLEYANLAASRAQ